MVKEQQCYINVHRLSAYQGFWHLHDTRAKKRAGSLATDPAHLGNHLFEKHSLEAADPLRAVST